MLAKGKMGIVGQSLIEFMLALPVLVGLVMLLTRAMSAMQISIVAQKYSRAQIFYLSGNSPVYPAIRRRSGEGNAFTTPDTMANEMVLGVQENVADDDENSREPVVQTQAIARKQLAEQGNDEGDDPVRRSKIRIFNTATLCTPSYVSLLGSRTVVSDEYAPRASATLAEGMVFDHCRGLPK